MYNTCYVLLNAYARVSGHGLCIVYCICCAAAGTYSNGYHWFGLSLLSQHSMRINFAGVIKHKIKQIIEN